MRKYLGIILLCIGIIFQGNNIVLADEIPTIKIEGIKQGDNSFISSNCCSVTCSSF